MPRNGDPLVREYELTTAPELSEQWANAAADEKAYTLVANRAPDDKIRTDAAERLTELTATRERLEDEIAAAARIVTVERVDPKTWGRIVAENPPRPDDPYDARMGVNTDTFDRAIMPHAITAVTDGTGTEVDWDWATLVDAMSPGKYEEIIGDVLRLHMEREAVPFSLADYRSRRASAPSSK